MHQPGAAQHQHLLARQPEPVASSPGQVGDRDRMAQDERRLQVHKIRYGRQRAVQLRFRQLDSQRRLRIDHGLPRRNGFQAAKDFLRPRAHQRGLRRIELLTRLPPGERRRALGSADAVRHLQELRELRHPCCRRHCLAAQVTWPAPPVPLLIRRADCLAYLARKFKVLRAPAEDLPFDDPTFDVAVSTLVLCRVDDQPRALRELRRVLRPGGRLLFIEHVRSGDPGTARLQDRMNWLNRLVVCCGCNRPTLGSIQEAGFIITRAEHTALPKAPKFVSPAIMGSATAPALAPSTHSPLAAGDRLGPI